MLARLRAAAERDGLAVEVVEGEAGSPPPGPFHAVIERHLLWTLPDPGAALAAWRAVAPAGRLVLFEGLWGRADPVEHLRQQTREGVRRLRGEPDHHHDRYDRAVVEALPLAGGTHPDRWSSWWRGRAGGRPGWSGCVTSSGPGSCGSRPPRACSASPRSSPSSPATRLA
jgi:hypothetical protein